MGNYHARCGAGEKHEIEISEAYLSLFGQLPDFTEKLSTMRKYAISANIILQGISQIKSLYDKDWATLIADCDTKLFLGTDDEETNKYITDKLGKRTTKVGNASFSKSGTSESISKDSLELLPTDMLAMQQDDECIVTIRGKRPLFDKKYELTDHPNYKYSHEHEGMYKIPVNIAAKNVKSDTPLHLRKQHEQQKSIIDVDLYNNGVFADIGEFVPHSNEDSDMNTIENAARKSEADEAINSAKECEKNLQIAETKGDVPENDTIIGIQEALNMLGVSEEMSSTEIKEAVYSKIEYQTAKGKKIQYASTNG